MLQDREFRPVGSTKILSPNFRLISSTNVNVENALKEGRLREDLYFRINTLTLHVPALRERPNDIPLLAEWFLQQVLRAAQPEHRSVSLPTHCAPWWIMRGRATCASCSTSSSARSS